MFRAFKKINKLHDHDQEVLEDKRMYLIGRI